MTDVDPTTNRTAVLVHGAWYGPWAWGGIIERLNAAGLATTDPPDLSDPDSSLQDHVAIVAAAVESVPAGHQVVLVGHSYAGLVVREVADRLPDRVSRIVLVDGWAGPDGSSLMDLAPESFGTAVRGLAAAGGRPELIPAPSPAAFGITDGALAEPLAELLVPFPIEAFTDRTSLGRAIERIPGTAICCEPSSYPFAEMAKTVGYRIERLTAPHDAMRTHPDEVSELILSASGIR
jgi:pimeloyl-ACP methyl ester carboxylesterase